MSAKNYFLVTLPDRAGAHEARKANMEEHMRGALVESGVLRVGGILLPEGSASTDTNVTEKSEGSFAVAQAESADKIWELLRADPFWRNGVWDTEKATVVPVSIVMPQFD